MRTFGYLLLLAASLAAPAGGQITTGRIDGRLVSPGSSEITARIGLTTPAAPGQRSVVTSTGGHFAASALPPGLYRVHIRAIGYRELIIEKVDVTLGETTSLGELTLVRSAVLLEPVVVRHRQAGPDPNSTAIASRMEGAFAEQLPSGRTYDEMVLLLPQAHPSRTGANIAGATGFENAYFVDGINVTEGFHHRAGLQLPPNFVDYVELRTGGEEAEFGRATGGIISVTTRSGGNDAHTSAFAHVTGSSLGAEEPRATYELASTGYLKYDAGLTTGGALARDRLWYFGAYDLSVLRANTALPGATHTDNTTAHHFAGKLTWRPDDRSLLTATLIGDPTRRELVGNAFWSVLAVNSLANADPYLGYWDRGGTAGTVSANRTFGTTLVEASIAHARFHDRTGPATERGRAEPLLVNNFTGEWSGGHGNEWDRRTTRTALNLGAAYERGPHTFKAGVQLEHNAIHDDWNWASDIPRREGIIFTNGEDFFIALPLELRARSWSRTPAAFAQASVLTSPRLRVNAGLRWDGQFFHGRTTGTSASITDEWQPRLALIAYPGGSPTHKVMLTAGRFYEQLPGQIVGWQLEAFRQMLNFYDADPRSGAAPFESLNTVKVVANDLRGQHYDELTLGYETAPSTLTTLRVRGSVRMLREVITVLGDPLLSDTLEVLANPGRGDFSALPRPKGVYQALELTLSRRAEERGPSALVSYVLSRNEGNYEGVASGNPNAQVGLVTAERGLRPNDRTHALKVALAQAVRRDLTVGLLASLQSGTPVTDLTRRNADPGSAVPIAKPGASGRTPTLWDLNLRATWDLLPAFQQDARIVADLLHIGSPRGAINVDPVRYLEADDDGSNPRKPNPFYRRGTLFQAPMALRLGVEVGLGGERPR